MRRTGRLAAALTLALGISALAQPEAGQRPRVVVAELDGIIHPIAAEYVAEVIDRADTSGAALVVVILRTPGGLLDSTREIVSRMIISRAPVVVFVTPSGGRAASAGFVLAMAADIAAMSPGTHIGAAHPVSGTGGDEDSTTADKAASDAAAYVRTLAAARHRNVALAEEAVLKSRAFTETEARDASPPLIDMVVPDLEGLLRQLDGRSVERFDGRKSTLALADAEIERVPMSWRQRFLGALAHPQIAYLLLTLGMLGLTVEIWNPGSILPGVAGGLCLLLAFFAFQIVPISTAGVLLVLFGVALVVLELKVPSFGALGIGGVISLLIGGIMMTRTVPGVSVSLGLIVPMAILTAALVLFLGRLALVAQRQPAVTGREGLIGAVGRTRTPISPDAPGQIDLRGEIWNAVSREPIAAGRPVRVRGNEGLTLQVEPIDDSRHKGDEVWKD
jgi:membrane-bound serine protease (ClpP class)